MELSKGIVYYTDNRPKEPIISVTQKQLLCCGLPVVSVSLKPMDFGKNIVVDSEPGAVTMFRQILLGLENIEADVVFFAEHDVLYHKSHFDFEPPESDVYYYNTNIWKWHYLKDYLITHDSIFSLSGLCANRKFLISHYRWRSQLVRKRGWINGINPGWARNLGYEPGIPRTQSGIPQGRYEERKSPYPNIDIRHRRTMTVAKMAIDQYQRRPSNWRQAGMDDIPGWNLREMFGL